MGRGCCVVSVHKYPCVCIGIIILCNDATTASMRYNCGREVLACLMYFSLLFSRCVCGAVTPEQPGDEGVRQ